MTYFYFDGDGEEKTEVVPEPEAPPEEEVKTEE